MKKNFFFNKKPKWGLIALFMTICCLFDNTAIAQVVPSSSVTNDIIVWTGNVSSDWNDTGNWYVQSRATTGVAGTSLYPGQVDQDDWAVIPTIGANSPIIKTGQTFQVGRLIVTNQFNAAGGTLTIDSGGKLNVVNAVSNSVILNGGNIVNNGTLSINSSGVGFTSFPAIGIQCGNPNTLPTTPTEWGYSGTGALSINLSGANFAGAAAIAVLGNSGATATAANNANVIYKMVLNNPTITYNQATNLSIAAFRTAGGNNANKLIIGGTGLTIGSAGSPYIGSLISLGGGSTVTVDSGTTLTLYGSSAATNTNAGITGFSASANATNLTNKGTINILGATSATRSAIGFATGASATASVFNISNEGTLNVNVNATGVGTSAFNIGNGGGGAANAGSVVNFNNASTGTITFKNTSTVVGAGNAIYGNTAGEAPRTIFTNDGIMNLEGTTYNFGTKMTINNNGTINSNSDMRSFTAINNNSGSTFNFVKTAQTNTTKQVVFNGVAVSAAASPGAVYTDGGGRQYTVVVQKYATFGTSITTNTLASTDTSLISATTGTLTKVSGTGDASIAFGAVAAIIEPPTAAVPSFTASSTKSALTSSTINSGTINTDAGSDYLNSLSGVSANNATSVLSPGGASGKGIAEFNRYSWVGINGTVKIQVSGNTTAGVDYDQVNNSVDYGGLDITNATLDVTGIYTPNETLTTPIDIMSTGTLAPLVGTFASVTGLTSGWSVVYTAPAGETIDPVTSLPYVPVRRDGGKVQLMFSTNPNISQLTSDGTNTISQGCEGTTLSILGTKFTGATEVTVNGVALTGVTVVSDSRIDAILPAGNHVGLVTVTTPLGSGSSAANFTVTSLTTTGSETISQCGGSYTWPVNNVTYTASATEVVTVGCNTATLNLTITEPTTTGSETISQCGGSYTWPVNNVTYTASTTEVVTEGCNTATLNLTITPATTTGSETISQCGGSYTWPVNNVTYTVSTTEVVSVGCNTATLNLTITPATTTGSVTTSINAGESYTWPANGQTYTTAQNGTTFVSGCNTATLNLTVITTQIPASPYAVCTGATVATATAGTTLKFYKDTKSTTAAYAGTQKLAAATYYVTEMVSGTESARVPVSVTLTALVAPTTIASTEAKVICKYMGTSNLVTFTTTPVAEASSYSWSVPAGATIEGNATGDSITVSFEAVSGTPGLIGSVTVDSRNSLGCLSGKAKILALTTKAPTAPKTVVLTNGATVIKKAGNFVGDATKELTLTATDISGTADHHVWTLPAGTTVVTGDANNDLVLTVHLGNVTASNDALVFSCASVGGCGSSSKSLSIARAAAGTPKAITLTDALSATPTVGIKKLDAYTGSLKTRTLTLTATPNVTAGSEATSYTWVLPAAATVVDGTATAVEGQENTYTSTSASISVNLASVATETSFVFKVYGVNGNGTSLLSKDLTCTSAAPKAPAAIFSGGTGSGTAFAYNPSCGTVTISVPAVLGVVNDFISVSGGAILTNVSGNTATIDLSATSAVAKSTITIRAIASTATGSSSKDFVIKLGTPCGAGKMISEELVAEDFTVIAYPNPSASEFTIESSSKGATTVQVYDMMGRLIENAQANANSVQVGRNYAAGTYNVIVSQGAKAKTLKVIKK